MRLDLRAVPRYFLLQPLDAESEGQEVRIVDLSTKGARLEVSRSLAPGSALSLVVDTLRLDGTVLWCQIDTLSFKGEADRYLVGLVFSQAPAGIDEFIEELKGSGSAIQIVDTRSAERYRLMAPLTGTFGDFAPVSIVDLSAHGARISSPISLEDGVAAVLRFQVDRESGPMSLTGRVVWCRSAGGGSRDYLIGLEIGGEEPKLRAIIDHLCSRDEARIDLHALKRKFDALRLEARAVESSQHAV